MYLGGPGTAAAFLSEYESHGPLAAGELQLLDGFRRLRWVVQAAYFARRLGAHDLTGIAAACDNDRGLDDAQRALKGLGLDT